MNPVGTKEQREELRQPDARDWPTLRDNWDTTLDGLDIAEERCIKSLETILKFYLDCGSLEEAETFEWVDWAEDAEDALAEWQAWRDR